MQLVPNQLLHSRKVKDLVRAMVIRELEIEVAWQTKLHTDCFKMNHDSWEAAYEYWWDVFSWRCTKEHAINNRMRDWGFTP